MDDQFAALCNMSRATFVRQFHESIGRSATDMTMEVRMTLAGRKLLESGLVIAEIGEIGRTQYFSASSRGWSALRRPAASGGKVETR